MNYYLKQYLLHLRDVLRIVLYLSPSITLPLLLKWIVSFRLKIELSAYLYSKKKHRFILNYLYKRYRYLIPKKLNETDNGNKLPIWIFWSQGINNMPSLVKLCYNSAKKNSDGRDIHLLDKNNFSDYIDLPDYIVEKHRTGIITMANFADILRLSLLAKYGGTWLDATLYVNKPLEEEKLNPYFESIKMMPLTKGTISDYKWASFYLYSKPNTSTMIFFRNVMYAYFKDGHKRIIDYLLIDYTFQMLYENSNEFKEIIDRKPYGSEYTYEMIKHLNDPYDANCLNRWKNQQFFKLNWRIKIEEGDTLFHHLEQNLTS